MITTSVKHTHQARERIEAWRYQGQKFENWPDWVRSHYENNPNLSRLRQGNWAIRDEEGYFWRWLRNDLFEDRYAPITQDKRA